MANKIYVGQEGAQELYRRVKALSANYATAEQGAKADAAYQKPVDGIPKSDLDSGVQASLGKADTALQEHQDISGKANKVANATSGNFAGLDANGELTDSGIAASDVATSVQNSHSHSNKAVLDATTASYTTEEQTKLNGIESSAEVNLIESVSVAGTVLDIESKSVNVPEAGGTAGAWVKGVVSGEDTARWDKSVLPATPSTDSVLMSQDSTKKWVSMTSNNYEIPLSLSPDIPYEYRRSYKQVEYIQSNDDCIMVNNLNIKSSDKFKVQFYVKNRYDSAQGIVACTETVNGSGSHGFDLQVNPAYYSGQFWYSVAFGSLNSYKVITYHSGSTYPDRPEFEARQEIIAEAPNLWVNGDNVINNATLVSKNLTCVRYVSLDSSFSKNIAFGIFAIYDNNDTLIEKLVPCLNKSTNKYGVFCVNQKQFYGAYSSGTITEYIPPST